MHGFRIAVRFVAGIGAGLIGVGFAAPSEAQVGAVGLSTVRSQRVAFEGLASHPALMNAHLSFAVAIGDFDGDGVDDLATSAPSYIEPGTEPLGDGIVVVRYGVAGAGISAERAPVVLSQAAGELDEAESHDLFGYALAACDFNGDGYDDLAVGVPGESVGVAPGGAVDDLDDAGGVQIHLGSSTGLAASGDSFFTLATEGIPGDALAGALLGFALACGDFAFVGTDDDLRADLAIGAPADIEAGAVLAGSVLVLPGSEHGPTAAGSVRLVQGSGGLSGAPEPNDLFGLELAAGDFDADGAGDLVIGVPGEDQWGVVQAKFGGHTPLLDTLFETLLGGQSEPADYFGSALATGDFDADGFDDLAIGILYKDFDRFTIDDAGQVLAVYGGAGGFAFGRTQFWHQGVLDPAINESGDVFGLAIATGDFDRDGYGDLAVSHPGESTQVSADGVVTVVMSTPTGLDSARHREFACGFEGLPGPALLAERRAGYSLAVGDLDGNGHDDLVLGAPYEGAGGLLRVGAARVLYGSLFSDGFESGTSSLWSSRASLKPGSVGSEEPVLVGR